MIKPSFAKSAPACCLWFPFCQQKLLRGSLAAHLCLFFRLLNINLSQTEWKLENMLEIMDEILKDQFPQVSQDT